MTSWLLIPVAITETAMQVGLGYRRHAPWISYRATWTLGRLIRPNWRILEFGSGMSTLWFAKRASFVFSVESNPEWYDRVHAELARRRVDNVRLELRPTSCAEYADVAEVEDASVDFALIDGICRDHCVQPCLRKIKPGGYIYLDNTDQPGDRQKAEAELLASPLASRRYYNDFAPGLVAITQGLLVRVAS